VPVLPGELVHDLPELAGDGSQEGGSGS
jgi:hypothetical protein